MGADQTAGLTLPTGPNLALLAHVVIALSVVAAVVILSLNHDLDAAANALLGAALGGSITAGALSARNVNSG